MIQFSAPISAGSSGGPLLDSRGKVVGVTTFSIVDAQNLNFAVPARRVAKLLERQGSLVPLSTIANTALSPDESATLRELGSAIDNEDFALALRLVSAMPAKTRNTPFCWYAQAYVHSRLGNLELAIDACRSVIRLDAKGLAAYHLLAECLRRENEHQQAIEVLKTAIGLDPSSAATYLELGRAHAAAGDADQAIAAFQSAVMLDPQSSLAYRSLAWVLSSQSKYQDAIEACAQAAQIEPSNEENFLLLADVCQKASGSKRAEASRMVQDQRFDEFKAARKEAEALCLDEIKARESAAKLDPNDTKNLIDLGLAYGTLASSDEFGLEYAEKALAVYRKLLDLDRRNRDALGLVAGSLIFLRRYDEGIEAYNRLSLDHPDDKNIRRWLDDAKRARHYDLRFDVPCGWKPLSSMPSVLGEIAKYALPSGSEKVDVISVDVRNRNLSTIGFEPSVDADVKQWAASFSKNPCKVRVETFRVGEFIVRYYELEGTWRTFRDGIAMEDYAMLAAFVEGRDGPWVFRTIGPKPIVTEARDGFLRMLKSVRRPS